MRFILTSVLLMTSVLATVLEEQRHNTNTYKRTAFQDVIEYHSGNINNEYEAYKLIKLIATGEGEVGVYSFNGIYNKLGTYEEHDKAFKLLQEIGHKYGSGFYIPYGDNYDFVRTAVNCGALNKWFEENKGLNEERNEENKKLKNKAAIKIYDLFENKIQNNNKTIFNNIKSEANDRDEHKIQKLIKEKFSEVSLKKENFQKTITIADDVLKNFSLILAFEELQKSDPSKIASIIKHFIGFPWNNASIAKYMNVEDQEGLTDLATYNPNEFSLEEKAFVLKLLSCIREKFGEIARIDEKEIKTSFGKTAYNYYLNIDGWKTNWAKETDPEKINTEFANVSKRKKAQFFDKEKVVFLINNHTEIIGENLLPLLDETIGRTWIAEDIVKDPEDYIKKIYETENINWENWFKNKVMNKYKTFKVSESDFNTRAAIYLMRYIEYKEPNKELLNEIWKIAVDHFSNHPFLMYNLTIRIFQSKNYTASELKDVWNNLHQEKKIKTSLAFFALMDEFGRVIISDNELLKYYNEGGPELKNRAKEEILNNRKHLKTKLGIQEIETVSSIQESIEAIKWKEFYDEVRKIYKPTLSIEKAVEKFKEELKKTRYYSDMSDESLSEKVREDSKKDYEAYKRQFDRNELKHFLPIIDKIIEESGKGYSDFFTDFSGVIGANINNNGDKSQSCKPASFAIIGLREYLTIAKFFTDGGAFSCCPEMDKEQKQMMIDSTMIYLNPMPVFEILGSSEDEEEFYELILKKYPVKNSYKEFENEYKERIKGMADWFWKLSKAGYISKMTKEAKEKMDFLNSLIEQMSIINYALTDGESLDNSIHLVLEKIKPYLEEKIINKTIDPKQMFSEAFQKELEIIAFEIFEYFGLKEENCGYIGLKKQKQIIRVGKEEIEKEISNPSSSLRGKIDKMIKDLYNKHSHLCIKVENSQNDEEDYLEY